MEEEEEENPHGHPLVALCNSLLLPYHYNRDLLLLRELLLQLQSNSPVCYQVLYGTTVVKSQAKASVFPIHFTQTLISTGS